VWERLASFRGDSAFTTWLHRLTVNVVLSARRSARRRWRYQEAAQAELHRSRPAPPGLVLDLEWAIARLPDGAREVFVLHDVEGYRHEEVARAAGIAVGTSKAQLFRARRLLREMLDS
jgi:RNA polymerase sigma-70 factor (ECF subfamily)